MVLVFFKLCGGGGEGVGGELSSVACRSSLTWLPEVRKKTLVLSMFVCLISYANNKGANQPAHPRSLISAFVVRCPDSIISLDSISEISSL